MRYRFEGLSKEEELHVMEMRLLTCILKLSKVEVCCHHTTLKMLFNTISSVEFLCKEGSIEPSKFFIELKKLLCEIGTSTDGASCSPFLCKLLEFISLEQFVFCGRLKHIKAELEIPGNDSENPLPSVSGLPVGITFKITLYNILSKKSLWLRMTVDEESTQFVFLDLNQFGGCDEVRNFTYIVPFYSTPKAISFTSRASIGMECCFEDAHMVKGCSGPKRELMYLCQDVEVHLSMGVKD